MRLIYVMDPMCGWCYGFQPELELFLAKYPHAQVNWIMGGLAPDTDQPMVQALRETISSYWHQIESKTKVSFNHDFWRLNTPIRATYQACRAVIAAQSIRENSAMDMAKAIQRAYYQLAQNPSLDDTLIACAGSIGLDKPKFQELLGCAQTQTQLRQHLELTRRLRVSGFPALFYVNEQDNAYPLTLGFCCAAELEQRFGQLLTE
ncbi:DsbA family protein [Pseudoalteromonas rubra]|uniref:DsbA family protein n=1 Tax=Pseudoalteromonas rubra TaxID=43658 RepID=A0A5S3WX88_9GAMM|nr:DsbA family protein [Pseudoalteromonas rubra]TMP35839.1 DsbA family protein [Pseudoalteromonas rubra]